MTLPTPPVDANQALADLTLYTSWSAQTIGNLSGQVDSLTAANGQLSQTNQTLASQNSTLIEANAELSDENQRLHDELDKYKPPPPPTVFGSSKPEQTVGNTFPVPGVRIYYQPGETPTTLGGTTLTAFQQAGPTGLVWFSIKELADTWLDALLTDMETKFPTVTILASADHEPKDGWWDTGKMSQWKARQDAFEAVLSHHPKVEGWTIVEGSSLADSSSGTAYWSSIIRDKQAFGIDSYNGGIQVPKAYKAPADIHGPRFDWVKQAGKDKVGVAETGTGIVSGDTTRTGQTQWVKDNRAYMLSNAVLPVRTVLWWNSGTQGPLGTGCRLTKAQMDLWLGR